MKVTAIYSGGMDSTVLLYWLVREGYDVRAVSVDYGQRHRREIEFAALNTAKLDIPHEVIDLRAAGELFGKGSSQADSSVAVPEGHYSSENMRITVVPNRNMIMLAVAAGVAIANGCEALAYGAHAGDHAIYPDCRVDFAYAMDEALRLCHEPGLTLFRPFVRRTKAEIAALGYRLGVQFEDTWSCYKGGDKHCGRCGTCTERLEALRIAVVPDRTEYEDSEFWKSACGQ